MRHGLKHMIEEKCTYLRAQNLLFIVSCGTIMKKKNIAVSPFNALFISPFGEFSHAATSEVLEVACGIVKKPDTRIKKPNSFIAQWSA